MDQPRGHISAVPLAFPSWRKLAAFKAGRGSKGGTHIRQPLQEGRVFLEEALMSFWQTRS